LARGDNAREQVSPNSHPRLVATLFDECHIDKVVQRGEHAIDIYQHRSQQDASLDAAHADAVPGQAKTP
jgi:hypothetical protein